MEKHMKKLSNSKAEEIKWITARCPHCGREYKFTGGYMPKTCGTFECVRKELHPELS